ncbi:MAG: penicillin acylase family protein [Candidatus Hydrogenedentes bacterium]|nr:penicillin acylase family protein [Candidatus Hydrogenedentota bacterium]
MSMGNNVIGKITLVTGVFLSHFLSSQQISDIYWEQIELYRDKWGVPHIFATNPRALGFGLGYAQAEDHWESMLLAYRLANGRLAEVLGEKEEESDKLSLQFGHKQFGLWAYQNCDSLSRELCEGFAEGVNSWILEHREKLPNWVDGVQPQDIFALWHAFIVSLAPLDTPALQKRPPAIKSGFAFALSSQKSKEDIPLFAISAHQYYSGPFRWYECHLICGDYNVYGCTFYGLPLILMGHSLRHAWAIVPNQSDFADTFIENPAPFKANPKSIYRDDNTQERSLMLLKYMSQVEPYYVATPEGIQQRFVPSHITSKGPLLFSGGNFYSWKIGGFEDVGIFTQLWEMGRAKSCEEYVTSVRMLQLPCFHILYIDSSNQVYYFYSAKVGTREPPPGIGEKEALEIQTINWRAPVQARFYPIGWRYVIAPEILPSILNPPNGFIQICGGPPESVTDDIQFPNYEIFKEKLIMDVENVVSRRIKGYLRTDKRSIEEVQSLLLDPVSALAIEIVPKIVMIAEKHNRNLGSYHPDLPYAVDLIRRWNLWTETKSISPVIFQLWTYFFTNGITVIPSIEMEPFLSLINNREDIEAHCLESLAESVRFLKNIRGSIDVSWGDIHKIKRGANEYAIEGSEIMGCSYLMSENSPIGEDWGRVNYGIGFAMVCILGIPVQSYTIVPFGISEEPNSKHFNDQWSLFSQRQLKKTYFLPPEIYSNAQIGIGRKVVLSPEIGIGEIRCVSSSKINVRIRSDITPPEELPQGLINFTAFHYPDYTPSDATVEFFVRLAVPPDLCDLENFPELSIYEFRENSGWRKLDPQNFSHETGLFEGKLSGKAFFCVLGEAKFLKERYKSPKSNTEPITSSDRDYQGTGIFSRGLPGEIPLEKDEIKTEKKTFSWKGSLRPEVLPKPEILPPIEKDKNITDNREVSEEKIKDAKGTEEKTDKENSKSFLKSKNKDSKDKRYVRKNFTVRKNSISN